SECFNGIIRANSAAAGMWGSRAMDFIAAHRPKQEKSACGARPSCASWRRAARRSVEELLGPVEPALLVGAVLGAAFPERIVQLLEQLALVLGELDGRFDAHVAVQVAGVAGAHALDALAA